MKNILCPVCGKLLAREIVGNLSVTPSSCFLEKLDEYEVALEEKCRGCKKKQIIFKYN